MNRLEKRVRIGLTAALLGAATLVTVAPAMGNHQVSAMTQVTVTTQAEAGNTRSQIKTSRFLHCSVKQYINYVNSLGVLNEDELKTLKKTEKKLNQLYSQREENRKSCVSEDCKENDQLDQEFDQLCDAIDKLLKKNEVLYHKIAKSIPNDVYAVDKNNHGITYEEYAAK